MAPSNPCSFLCTMQPLMVHPARKLLVHHGQLPPASRRHAEIIPILLGSSINLFSILKHTTQRKLQISQYSLHHQFIPCLQRLTSHHHFLSDHWLRYQTALAREDAVLFFTKCALLWASSPWFFCSITNSSLHFNSSSP